MSLNDGKQVGDPCGYCQKPLTQGKFGAYCKPCYIDFKNKQDQKPTKSNNNVDWDEVNRGKVRHGLICAFIQGKSIDELKAQFPDFKLQWLLPLEQLIVGKPKTQSKEELPTIQVDEKETSIEDIPF